MESRSQIGIVPKYIWQQKRLTDLAECIERRITHFELIKEEWVKEYNELIKELPKERV